MTFEMGLNCFFQLDTRYFHLYGKFESLIHYLLLVLNDFVFLKRLECQFCKNGDILSDFSKKNNNK